MVTDESLAALYAYPSPPDGPPRGAPVAHRWLRANMVASLDGAATLDGRSGGLSGEADREVFALLRALADVIVVGAGTVRAEGYGPVRPGVEGTRWDWLRRGRAPSPPIAVITGRLDLDLDSPLLAGAPAHARTIVFTTRAAPAPRRAAAAATADVVVCGETRVDLAGVLDALAGRGHRRILTEGGPHLLAQFAAAGLLDELCLTLSPMIAGPGTGRSVRPADAPAGHLPRGLALAHVVTDGTYLLCRYLRPQGPAEPAAR